MRMCLPITHWHQFPIQTATTLGLLMINLLIPCLGEEPVYELERLVITGSKRADLRIPVDPPDRIHPLPGSPVRQLEQWPGVWVQQRGDAAGEPLIRGMGFDRVVTTLNGLRLPNGSPTRTHSPVNRFSPESYRNLTIETIVPSLSLGPPASAGWIELNVDPLPDIPASTSTRIGYSWTPDRNGQQASILHNRRTHLLEYHASAHWSRLGNYDSGDGREVPSRSEASGASFTLGLETDDRQKHVLDVIHQEEAFIENASLPLDTEHGSFWAVSGIHEMSDPAGFPGEIRLRYGYATHHAILNNFRRGSLPMPIENNARTDSWHTDLRWQSTFHQRLEYRAGIDYNRETRSAIRRRGGLRDFIWPDILFRQTGFYAETTCFSTPRTTLRTGIRHDLAMSEARDRNELAFGHTITKLYTQFNGEESPGEKRSFSVTSANALLLHEVSESVQVYLGTGYTGAMPSATEQYRAFLNALGGGFEIGNPSLEIERRWEISIGSLIQTGPLNLGLHGFRFQMDDFIWRQKIADTTSILPNQPPHPVFGYRNIDVTFQGVEISGSYALTPTIRLPFTIEWVDSTLRESGPGYRRGDSIPEIPPAHLTMAIDWNWSLAHCSGLLRWTGEWYAGRENPLPELNAIYRSSQSHLLHHFAMQINVKDGWRLSLTLYNVFNRRHFPYLQPPASSVPASSGAIDPGSDIPGPGRIATLAISRTF